MHKPAKIQSSLLCCGNVDSAVYFYHSDHLGSASWITNKSGNPVQYLQYIPYGEPLVNERTGSYEERSYSPLLHYHYVSTSLTVQIPNGNAIANLLNLLHTGKERDSETGFSYFGARYYDSDILTGWLSVDPMADKYPSLSPYAYCAWNPVKLVDPDGEDPDIFMFPLEDKSYSVFYKGSKFIKQRDNAFQIMAHGNSSCMREVRNGKNVPESEGEINSAQKFDNVFRNNSKWNLGKHKKGFSVVLFSCNTGKGNNSLAMNLSLEYGQLNISGRTIKSAFLPTP